MSLASWLRREEEFEMFVEQTTYDLSGQPLWLAGFAHAEGDRFTR